MQLSISHGLHCRHYDSAPGEGGYVSRNAAMLLMAQIEVGHGCPISMTGAALHAMQHQPDLADEWGPKIRSRIYDPVLAPPDQKPGVLLGMSMTERQGGSDVRANTSTAAPVDGGGPGGEYRLTGSKWFVSAPMCDAFLTLAYAAGGLSCFLLPRVRPDGDRNSLRLVRLKDKLGNRSNASSEMELSDATAWLIGEEGRGVRTIIDMVAGTRLDCSTWAVALMRQAVTQAGWHVAHRVAFGATLIDKPLMQNVLADLEIETEAATLLDVRLAGAFERAPADPDEAALARLGAAMAKYWLTKRSTPVVRKRSSAWGATATSRNRFCRASTGKRRSTRSGRARATSSRSTCSGPWLAHRTWPTPSSRSWSEVLGSMVESTAPSSGRATPSAGSPIRRSTPADSSNTWPSPGPLHSSFATATRTSPRPTCVPASTTTGAPSSAPSPATLRSPPSPAGLSPIVDRFGRSASPSP